MKNTVTKAIVAVALLLGGAVAWIPSNTTTLSTAAAMAIMSDTADAVRAQGAGAASDTVAAHIRSGAFVDTLMGLNAVVTDSVYWATDGIIVDLTVLAASGTSSSDSLTLQHLPAFLRPARVQPAPVYGVTDSAVAGGVGAANVYPSGLIRYSVYKLVWANGRVVPTSTMVTTLTKGFATHKIRYNLR